MHVYIPMFMYSIYTITFARYEFCQNYHFTILIFIAKTSLLSVYSMYYYFVWLKESWIYFNLEKFYYIFSSIYIRFIIWVTGILLKYYLVQYSASNEFIAIFSQADSTFVQTHTKTYISFLTSWGHAHLKTPLQYTVVSNMDKGIRNELKRNF